MEHGIWIEEKTTKTIGSTIGTATVTMDTHTLAYLLKGLNCRIGIFERAITSHGELPEDDKVSFEYTKDLRNSVESTRDKTLAEEK